MNKFLIISFCVLSQLIFAQTNEFNNTDDNGLKQGKWIKYFSNGKVKYEATFLDNVPVGIVKKYYKTGTLKAEMLYENEVVRTKIYSENVKITGEGNYINKVKDSTWNYYSDITGKLISKENYINGKKHGLSIVSFEDGVIAEELLWENGVKHGKWITYFPSGKTKSETHYKNGNINGIFNLYFPNGRLEITGNYLNGSRHGKWIYYDDNSNMISEVIYKNGMPDNREEMIEETMKEFEEYEKTRHLIKEPKDEIYNY